MDKFEQAALDFCNRVRDMQGMDPVDRLEPGVVRDQFRCVIAETAKVEAGIDKCYIGGVTFPYTFEVEKFVARFDNYRYPKLIDDCG